jgi:Tol biopolymer transport system component
MKWVKALVMATGIAIAVPCIAAPPSSPAARNGRIAFHAQGDIYSVAPDGTDLLRLTTDASGNFSPSWSADGSRIAFASYRDGSFEIYVMDADGANQVRLTSNTDTFTDDGNPTWSPDGTKIAFHRFIGTPAIWDIYTIDVSSRVETRLTDLGDQTTNPAWSPDGTRIAFTSYAGCGHCIYVMNADGSGITQLTNQNDQFPRWSADGTRIYFGRNQGIYVMEPDGKHQLLVHRFDTGDYAAEAVPSPDGQEITLSRTIVTGGSAFEVITVTSLKGKPGETMITSPQMNAEDPDWQPLIGE